MSAGVIDVRDGRFEQSDTGTRLCVGEHGFGLVSVSGGGVFRSRIPLWLGSYNDYNGAVGRIVAKDGGTLEIAGTYPGGSSNEKSAFFSGGVLKPCVAPNVAASFFSGVAASIGSGGLTVDTAGRTMSLAAPLSDATGNLKQSNLVHRWSFTDGSLADSVGSIDARMVGSNVGGVAAADGQLTLPGGGHDVARIELGNGAVAVFPNSEDGFTLELWATLHTKTKNYDRVFSINENWVNSQSARFFSLCWTTSNDEWDYFFAHWQSWMDQGTWQAIANNSAPYRVGREQHIAAVFAPGESGWTVTLYRHDAETTQFVKSKTITSTNPDWTPADLSTTLIALGYSYQTGNPDANASYNEVRIWNKALTADDLLRSAMLGPDTDFTGDAALVKTGDGSLTLAADNSYAGPTRVLNGTLALSSAAQSSTLPSTTPLSISSGATLALSGASQTVESAEVSGTVSGPGTLRATDGFFPGGENTIGTMTVADGATLSGDVTLDFAAGGICDRIVFAAGGTYDVSRIRLVPSSSGLAAWRNAPFFVIGSAAGATLTGDFDLSAIPNAVMIRRANGDLHLSIPQGTLILFGGGRQAAHGEKAVDAVHANAYIRFLADCYAAGQTSPDFLLGAASSMEKVMPRGRFAIRPVTEDGLSLRLAGNEYEGVQLLVSPRTADLDNVTVRLEGDLFQSGRDAPTARPLRDGRFVETSLPDTTFPAANVSISPVGYVQTVQTPPYKVADAVMPGSGDARAIITPDIGWWPDPILGFLGAVAIRDIDVQSFWIRVHCPDGQPAGVYRGALVVSARDSVPVRVPFAVRVNGFSIGRTSALPLAVTFGPCVIAGEGPEAAAAAEACRADPLAPVNQWQKHEREWVSFLADYLIPFDNLYHRDWTSVLYAARQLRDEGRAGLFNLGNWGMPASLSDVDMAVWRENTIPRLTAMRDLASALGVLDHAYCYGSDEAAAQNFPLVAAAVRELKAAFPGIPVFTTAQDRDYGVGTSLEDVDWFAPKISAFSPAKAAAARAEGRKVWWYTCNLPHAPYPNFFIECPAIEARLLMGAQAVQNRPDGFLYYATSIWNSRRCIENGPFTDWDPRSWGTYHGDGSWTCAGPGGTPLPTIRLENFRDGLEDYAYAMLLEQKLQEVESQTSQVANSAGTAAIDDWIQRAQEALSVPREVVDAVNAFTGDPSVLYRWRDEMADLIEQATTTHTTSTGETT